MRLHRFLRTQHFIHLTATYWDSLAFVFPALSASWICFLFIVIGWFVLLKFKLANEGKATPLILWRTRFAAPSSALGACTHLPLHQSRRLILILLLSYRYVFKRLRFLGNKNLSHLLALMFLALWHGLFIGYFFCFFGEFLIMLMEKQVVHQCQDSNYAMDVWQIVWQTWKKLW